MNSVFREKKKNGARTTGGAVLVAGAALESAASTAEAEAEAGVCNSRSNSSTAHGTKAGSVSLCVCLVDQPPENRYTRTAACCSKSHTAVLVYNVAQQCLSNHKMPHTQYLVPVKSNVAAPISTNSRRLTAKPAREELSVICACTGPVGTALGAVYAECGGQTWPKNLIQTFTHTHTEKVIRGTLPSYATRDEDFFFL